MKQPFNEAYFAHDNDKIRFYTGLPAYDVLSKFQEIVLTLMKLKLNMPMQDLAYCFGISLATVSRIFSAWIVVLSVCLAPLIRWPKYEDSWRTMPQCFQAVFGNKTMVIIKCYEAFITRPSNLMAQAQTFSTYKNFDWNNSTREYFIPLRRLGRKYPRWVFNWEVWHLEKLVPGDGRPWLYFSGKPYVPQSWACYTGIHQRKRSARPNTCWGNLWNCKCPNTSGKDDWLTKQKVIHSFWNFTYLFLKVWP